MTQRSATWKVDGFQLSAIWIIFVIIREARSYQELVDRRSQGRADHRPDDVHPEPG